MHNVILFDIDDTLYLEREYVRSGFSAVGRGCGEPAFGARCWELFCEGVRGNTFDIARRAFPQIGCSVAEMVAMYRAHRPDIALCPDARTFLQEHRGRMGVISDGPIRSQRAKFQALGLIPWIDCPLFTQEIGAPKPSPVPFRILAATLNVSFDECTYVADNPAKDFIGPKSLGMHTVRIRRPGSLHEAVPPGDDVDREITSFEEF